jgi:hypothetical protein
MIVGLLVFNTLWSRHRPFSYHSLYVHRPSISLGLFWYRQILSLPLKVQEEERWIYFRVEYIGGERGSELRRLQKNVVFFNSYCQINAVQYMYSIV